MTDTSTSSPPPSVEPPSSNGSDATSDDTDGSDANVASQAQQIKQLRQADRAKAARVKELEAELAKATQASLTDHEKAIAEAVAAKDTEWASKYLSLRIERLAATRLRDPADSRLLDAQFDPDASDEDITKALEGLVEAKPYLGLEDPSRRPLPPLEQGVRNAGKPPAGTDMNALIRGGRNR